MDTNTDDKTQQPLSIPQEFYKIINDFVNDIKVTFPEYTHLIDKWWVESDETKTQTVFIFCSKVFPERFFDILYKNTEIFNDDSNINTEFLPGIVFKQLWKDDISNNTKDTIWKYLQLILFAVVKNANNTDDFGETVKLFECIDQDELKNKLEDAMENMQHMFDNNDSNNDSNSSENTMPNAEDLHNHINSMMNGKLGKLAMELAEETAKDLDIDMNETGDTKNIYQKLFKNPAKMMNMVKKIGTKIDGKIKSGEIKESELMSEGMDLLNKMKDMPGMKDMESMLKKMGLGGKLNTAAMSAKMSSHMKHSQMKERMKAKAVANANAREQEKDATKVTNIQQPVISEEEIIKIFSTGEQVEKTPRKVSSSQSQPNKKKKKKKK